MTGNEGDTSGNDPQTGATRAGRASGHLGMAVCAVYMAVRAAGMNAHYTELPGAHNWQTFSAALAHELPWLAQRIGLTK